MTREEAIRILTLERDDWETSHCSPFYRREAFQMAIKSLSEDHIADADKKEASFACNHEADLISRKEAIDEADEWMDAYSADMFEDVRLGIQQVKRSLRKLPSAQPEIIRCGQCKYAEVADSEDSQDGYTCQFHRGSIWFSGSYCSWAERRQDEL